MDKFTRIILVAGIACFAFAFLLSGLYPWLITDHRSHEASIAELAEHVSVEFKQMREAYPATFAERFGKLAEGALGDAELNGLAPGDPRRAASDKAWSAAYAEALQRGRDIYVAEACWHCHSQYVRPVANEEIRFGKVRTPAEDNNALQRPVLWGTRRVGPDLTHEGGLRSNDWHVAHLINPKATSPGSIMPAYTWYFHDGYQVRRRIDPRKAEVYDLDPETSYPYPGVYATEADAQAALERIRATIDPVLEAEKERLFVDAGYGPNGDALCLISYLQWLGTYEPMVKEDAP